MNRVSRRFAALTAGLLLLMAASAAGGQPSTQGGQTVSVKEPRFGARGDGVTDDTAAIQRAVDWLYAKGGGRLLFPPGTYLVTSVNIREGITYEGYGATIKRPEQLTDKIGQKAAKWVRTFTTQKYKYCGQADSRPLILRGLTFDGSSQTQGPYKKYELEHAALVFLTGDKNCPGRLTATVEDCVFKNAVADGLSVYVNVNVKMTNCLAENCFRGGFVLTGGHSRAEVRNLTTRGKIDPTGIDVEVDGAGYGGSFKVEVHLENLNLEDGDFDVGVRDGSLVVGKNLAAEAPFNLTAPRSTVRLQDCRFGVGPGNRLNFPGDVTFERCEFFVSSRVPDRPYRQHSAAPLIVWTTKYFKGENQKLSFRNCRFVLPPGYRKNPEAQYYGLLTTWDDLDYHNKLEIAGGSIEGEFDVGLGMTHRGGRWRLKDLTIEAALPLALTGFATPLGRSFLDIVLDGVQVRSSRYLHLTGYPQPNDNFLEHRSVVIPAEANVITSTYGLEGNRYAGHRLIRGAGPPTPATHGLPGDIYEQTGFGKRWRCIRAGYVKIRDGKEARVESRWEEMPSGSP